MQVRGDQHLPGKFLRAPTCAVREGAAICCTTAGGFCSRDRILLSDSLPWRLLGTVTAESRGSGGRYVGNLTDI